MILLFTDFGLEGPYTGQVKARLYLDAPEIPVFDLFADAPSHDPRAAAYLLAAYAKAFPRGSVFLAVVDPGVGGARAPLMVEADGRWYVGPDNGLFEIVARRSDEEVRALEITWRPPHLSHSFHGRDLFAPVAASLASGRIPESSVRPVQTIRRSDWPRDLAEIIYLDRFGNGMTGLSAQSIGLDAELRIDKVSVKYANTFSDVPPGQIFWYENANGLVEVAANLASAERLLELSVGTPISLNSTAR